MFPFDNHLQHRDTLEALYQALTQHNTQALATLLADDSWFLAHDDFIGIAEHIVQESLPIFLGFLNHSTPKDMCTNAYFFEDFRGAADTAPSQGRCVLNYAIIANRLDIVTHLLSLEHRVSILSQSLLQAMDANAYDILDYLLNLPNFTPKINSELLSLWAKLGTGDVGLDACITRLARHFFHGPWRNQDPTPYHPALTMEQATKARNLDLIYYLIGRKCPSPSVLSALVEELLPLEYISMTFINYEPWLPQQTADVVECLLNTYPQLIKRDSVRCLLAALALQPEPEPRMLARAQSLTGRYLTLTTIAVDWVALLPRWAERMPAKLRPAIHRHKPPVPSSNKFLLFHELVQDLLPIIPLCVTQGQAKAELSLLADILLEGLAAQMDMKTFEALLQPGQALADESTIAMCSNSLDESGTQIPRQWQAVLIAQHRKGATYDL